MDYHSITKTITDLLTQNNCWFKTFEHEPVRTSEEAAKIRPGYTLKQGAKALIVRVKKSETDKKFVGCIWDFRKLVKPTIINIT